MAIVVFELEDLKNLGISENEARNATNRLGMSLEAMDESSITIDITPNRPDMLDIVGFARAARFLEGKTAPKDKFYSMGKTPAMTVNVTKAVKKIRPFIVAAVIKGADLSGNKLKNLINFTEKFCDTYGRKRKKIAIGLYALDEIEGPLKYDASKEGEIVPLGSESKASFVEVVKSHAKGREYGGILEKAKAYPFLTDARNVLSLIPVINSEHCRVTNTTKTILVELTGTSQNALNKALELIVCSFIDMKAEVHPCEIVYPTKRVVTPSLEYKSVRIRKSVAEKTLGIKMEDNAPVGLANKLGHVAAKYGNSTLVYVPPYRVDVLNGQDIIEDMAIAYGYNNIGPLPVLGASSGTPEQSRTQNNSISRLMVGMGYSEAMNFYLTNEHMNFESLNRKAAPSTTITVTYAKTETITMLRTNLLHGLLQNLGTSTNERMPQRLFEVGSVFHLGEDGKPVEETSLAIANEHSKANYSEMKSVVLELLKFLEVSDYSLKELHDHTFIEGRGASVVMGNETLANFGELHPSVLANFKIEEPVVAAELRLGKLFSNKEA